MKSTVVLYHAHCADGFGAAFAAWCALGDSADYLPVQYGEQMPSIPDGTRVYIVDFSYPDNARAREELCALSERCPLIVIDHHKTAQAALTGLPFALFDMEKSGAVLAWEYFRLHQELEHDSAFGCHGPVPKLLEFIQDRDLWRWQLPRSREVSAGLALVERDFDTWLGIVICPDRMKGIIAAGENVLKRDAGLVASMCERSHWRALGDHQEVLCANAPILQSEVCHELLLRNPDQMIVAAYFDKSERERVWSLRARPGCDCSEIAKANGGGGHAQAAGFTEAL